MRFCQIGVQVSGLLLLAACGTSVPAAATRVLDANAVELARAPVCFTPTEAESLIDRDRQAQVVEVCEAAAREQGVRVVTYAAGQCLPASLRWESGETGAHEAECSRTLGGAECSSTAVHRKSLRLVLTNPRTNRPLVETMASIDSSFAGFSRESLRALCRAAFHDYPNPLSSAQFDVSVD